MLKVDSDTLYGLDELGELLKGTVELPTFLDRLGLRSRRVFKSGLWGWEILEAARKAQPFSEVSESQAAAAVVDLLDRNAARGCRKKNTVRTPLHPTGRLSARDLRD